MPPTLERATTRGSTATSRAIPPLELVTDDLRFEVNLADVQFGGGRAELRVYLTAAARRAAAITSCTSRAPTTWSG
jgi:hypothetical protein